MREVVGDRPDHDQYFMGVALAVRARANCTGRKVGAVLVKDNRIIATGYNGTPEGMTNCDEGGCYRCANREQSKESARASSSAGKRWPYTFSVVVMLACPIRV